MAFRKSEAITREGQKNEGGRKGVSSDVIAQPKSAVIKTYKISYRSTSMVSNWWLVILKIRKINKRLVHPRIAIDQCFDTFGAWPKVAGDDSRW